MICLVTGYVDLAGVVTTPSGQKWGAPKYKTRLGRVGSSAEARWVELEVPPPTTPAPLGPDAGVAVADILRGLTLEEVLRRSDVEDG
jgi:hypothetical protein